MNNDELKEFANILFAPSERDEYKRRIEKAIECIKNSYFYSAPEFYDEYMILLNILEGKEND